MTMSGLMNSSAGAASPVGRNSPVKRSMMRLFDSAVTCLVSDSAEAAELALPLAVPAAAREYDR